MDHAEIVSVITLAAPGIRAGSVTAPYPDETRAAVPPEAFKAACLALHQALRSPAMMLFACDERARTGTYAIRCVFMVPASGRWVAVTSAIPGRDPAFDSLAKDMHSAMLFEREIAEMFGIEPRGNPDRRTLHLHEEVWPASCHPLRKDFAHARGAPSGEYAFGRVEGEGIFEVPVGPVHAGIIGPGHFRFSVAGEPIINLEARLGFTHRGVEKLFEGRLPADAIGLSERVSGDAAFAHSLAFTHAIEKIALAAPSVYTQAVRGVCLELERLYNHVNDLGGMATDVGFSFPAAYAAVIKEALLQLNEKVSGSRYLKGANAIGAVGITLTDEMKAAIRRTIAAIGADIRELVGMLTGSVSFMDRVDTTGILMKRTAEDLGVVGLAARASGIPIDVRSHFPGIYRDARFAMATATAGDVLARLKVRAAECDESVRLIGAFLDRSPLPDRGAPYTARAGEAIGCAEGWRGVVLYWVKTDEAGMIERCKIVDPSFHNWQALSYAALGNIIPDFPLCNKSFDLSYSGNDL